MNINYKDIINIQTKKNLDEYIKSINKTIDSPIYEKNYIFHYFTLINNLNGLVIQKFPVYIENQDKLNCFHLAAKQGNIDILIYLIKQYPEYIYNRNYDRHTFVYFLNSKHLIILLKMYPDLDWYDLIINDASNENLLYKLINNLNYDDLIIFLKLNFPLSTNLYYLPYILFNTILSDDAKITILDNYTLEELNIKLSNGDGLILIALYINNETIFKYLLDRNIDIDYYTIIQTNNPLRFAMSLDIINNTNIYTIKLLNKLVKLNKTFYKDVDKYNDNIFHSLLYIRINRNSQLDDLNNINYTIDYELFKYSDSEALNHLNNNKKSPLELLTNLNYNIYSCVIKKDILINPNIITVFEKKINKNIDNQNIQQWLNFYNTLPKSSFNDEPLIDIDEYQYYHYSLFRARFTDLALYSLYIADTHVNLFLPNLKSYNLNNLTYNLFYYIDDLPLKESIFPWIIYYKSENEYYFLLSAYRIETWRQNYFCNTFFYIRSSAR